MLIPSLVSAPTEELFDLVELKKHLIVDHNEDNEFILSLVNAAISYLDGWSGILGRALLEQTWRQDFSRFVCLRLALGPVQSITSIEYVDEDGVERTLDSSVYVMRTDAKGSYIDLAHGQQWPQVRSQSDAVRVEYVCGNKATDVPAALKHAVLLLAAHWYANREAASSQSLTDLPLGVDALIRPFRRIGV